MNYSHRHSTTYREAKVAMTDVGDPKYWIEYLSTIVKSEIGLYIEVVLNSVHSCKAIRLEICKKSCTNHMCNLMGFKTITISSTIYLCSSVKCAVKY